MNPVIVFGTEIGSYNLPYAYPDLSTDLLCQANVLAGGTALLERWRSHAPAAQCLSLGSNGVPFSQFLEAIHDAWHAGKRVVVLADGDPLYFGIGSSLARLLPPQAVRILPGLSSLQTACSRIGISWSDVRSMSLHGREDWTPLAVAAGSGKALCILGDLRHGPSSVARWLLERGGSFRMHVFTDMNTLQEAHQEYTLQEASLLDDTHSMPTLILIPESTDKPPSRLMPSQLVTDGSLITKPPIRAAALACLDVTPDSVVWDIGSGSGSVAFAASALAWNGLVFAVEQHEARSAMIRKNRQTLRAFNVEILTAKAPWGLDGLPDPDCIFLGGGLAGLYRHATTESHLLDALAQRLKPGGKLVAACALLGSVETMRSFARQRAWPYGLMLIQASESVPLADDERFEAHNPVFLFHLEKPHASEA